MFLYWLKTVFRTNHRSSKSVPLCIHMQSEHMNQNNKDGSRCDAYVFLTRIIVSNQVLRPRATVAADPGAGGEPAQPHSLPMDAADANAIAEVQIHNLCQ